MPGDTHSIGSVWFNDDRVYFAVGDGMVEEGAFWQGQGIPVNVGTGWAPGLDWGHVNGKVWRMNLDGSGRSVVFRGLRNPFHCAPVPGQGGANAVCGNVGWYSVESVLRIRDGGSGGWPCFEGSLRPPFNQYTPACGNYYNGGGRQGEVLYEYRHNGQSMAVIGGDFFSGLYGSYAGLFVFGDYVQSWVRAVSPGGGGARDVAFGANDPVAFRTSPDGVMYYIANCLPCGSQGQVRRFRPNGWSPQAVRTTSTSTTTRTSKTTTTSRTTSARTTKTTKTTKTTSTKTTTTSIWTGTTDTTSTATTQTRASTSTRTTKKQAEAASVVCSPKTGYPALPTLAFSQDSFIPVGPAWPNIVYTSNGGRGPIEINMAVGSSAPLDGPMISIGGVRYLQGLGTFGTSNFTIPLNGQCYRLTGYVGCDDSAGAGCAGEFYIRDDKRRGLFNSTKSLTGNALLAPGQQGKFVKSGNAPLYIDISNLQGVQSLQFWAYKPFSNTMKMDATRNFLSYGQLRLHCGPESPFLPKVSITGPDATKTYEIGDKVTVTAKAFNYDGTEITDPGAFYWTGFIIHGQGNFYHQHPLTPMMGTSMDMTLSDHFLDAGGQWFFYNARVAVTDSCGRTYWTDINLKLNLNRNTASATTTPVLATTTTAQVTLA
jgi:hypothetical protein